MNQTYGTVGENQGLSRNGSFGILGNQGAVNTEKEEEEDDDNEIHDDDWFFIVILIFYNINFRIFLIIFN